MNGLIDLLVFMPMAAALLSYLLGRKTKAGRNAFVGAVVVLEFLFSLLLAVKGQGTESVLPGICGMGLRFTVDGFRAVYVVIAAFMWMVTGLFSPDYFAHYRNRNRYYLFQLVTLGATEGIFLSADLYTTFVFFEIMSLASYVWVAQDEKEEALKAASTYLAVAVIGGLVMLMGLFLLYHQTGTLMIGALPAACAGKNVYAAAACLFVGFGAKAGAFPLHIWLPKAHPVAPAPASALLSGILTKSGVFGLIVVCARLMPGNESFGNVLLVLASVTMFLGALLALLSVDLKRTLACSSMSQIGFITVGLSMMVLLGEHGGLAAYGTLMHMLNHSLIKLVLFMAAGVVYMNLHKLNLNDIRGFGRNKPILHAAFLLGAVSIACIPPIGSGYNSKSLLHEAILEYIVHLQEHGHAWGAYKFVEILFLISGGLTVAYMTKLYMCIFWEKNATRQAEFDAKKRCMSPLSSAVLLASAAVLPFLGALPSLLLDPLGARSVAFFGQHSPAHAIHYFSWANLIGAAQSIGIGAVVYWFIVRKVLIRKNDQGVTEYVNLWPEKLDLEELVYRPLLMVWLPKIFGAVCGFIASIPDSKLVRVIIPGAIAHVTEFIANIPDSRFIRVFCPQVVTAIVRFFSELPEHATMFLRRTVFCKREERKPVPVGNRFTYACGRMINALARLLNGTVLRRRPMRTDFEYVFDALWTELSEGVHTLTLSVSFGLLLLCIGLFITCLYLLR